MRFASRNEIKETDQRKEGEKGLKKRRNRYKTSPLKTSNLKIHRVSGYKKK